jgi:hypothetical protein
MQVVMKVNITGDLQAITKNKMNASTNTTLFTKSGLQRGLHVKSRGSMQLVMKEAVTGNLQASTGQHKECLHHHHTYTKWAAEWSSGQEQKQHASTLNECDDSGAKKGCNMTTTGTGGFCGNKKAVESLAEKGLHNAWQARAFEMQASTENLR